MSTTSIPLTPAAPASSTARLKLYAPSLEVTTVTDWEGFRALESEWNHLVTSHNDSLFVRHEFLRVWAECFAKEARIQVLTGRAADGRLVAVLPLMQQRGSFRGVPLRQAGALANRHSCRFDMVAEDPAAAGRALFRHLAARDDWDVLEIPDVPEGGQAWQLYHAAASEGFPVGAWQSQRSPYLLLPGSADELQGRVSSQMRSNARRRLRQMQQRARVQFERLQEGDLAPMLADFFEVERSGWKGREGTACDQDVRTHAFYTRLAQVAAERNWLSLFRLTLDGQTAAFHYGLTYGGRYLLPKLAFREKFGDLSPGLVLMHEVIRDCIERKLPAIDFLGSDDEWKLRWSRTVLPHYWLYIYRNNLRGRLLHKMKFTWGPCAKHLLERGTGRGVKSHETT